MPRCLSNHIKLKIFPPNNPTSMSASMASLSSGEEDLGPWELTSDPHVTRSSSTRLSRTNSYTHFADDESSDASTSAGFADGCGIQGTFPSADRLRIRWATPMKAGQIAEATDGRRRAGIREVKADLTCSVLGKMKGKSRAKGTEGLLVRLDYTATCRGVWFPGVATLLGLDVCLEGGEGCDISWAPGMESKWNVTGSSGFTGFAVGRSLPKPSGKSSPVGPPVMVLPSSPDTKKGVLSGIPIPSRQNPTSSPASLLHAPLPAENVSDFSFDESSPSSTPTGTLSSIASLTQPSSPERERRSRSRSRSRASSINGNYPQTDTDVDQELEVQSPQVPITVHVNMNELQPPPKNTFTFSVSGVVLVTPLDRRHTSYLRPLSPHQSRSPSDTELDFDPIALPTFRVPYSEKESITTIIRSEIDGALLDVFDTSGDTHDPQARKATLQKGGHIKCGSDGARVAPRPIPVSGFGSWDDGSSDNSARRSRSYRRAPHRASSRILSTSVLRTPLLASSARLAPQLDGPLMIPFVTIDVTPLWAHDAVFVESYAVHVSLPAPLNAETEWLEFGLALPGMDESPPESKGASGKVGNHSSSGPLRVNIASASVEGVSVRFETSLAAKQDNSLSKLGMSFEDMQGKDWITWVRVHVGDIGGGKVDVVYLVTGIQDSSSKEKVGKERHVAGNAVPLDILLPSFSLSVGRLEVNVQLQAGMTPFEQTYSFKLTVLPGYELASMRTNLAHQQSIPQGRKLLHYSMEEFFYPRLSTQIVPTARPTRTLFASQLCRRTSLLLAFVLPSVLALFLLINLHLVTTELHEVKQAMRSNDVPLDIPDVTVMETVTVTSTVLVDPSPRWWFSPDTESTSESITLSIPSSHSQSTYIASSSSTSTSLPTSILPSPTTSMPSSQTGKSIPPPIHIIPIWRINFTMPPVDVPPSMRGTFHSMLNGLHNVWQFLRKVLHYPLDPP